MYNTRSPEYTIMQNTAFQGEYKFAQEIFICCDVEMKKKKSHKIQS